jgi:hypothetical protein
MAQTGAAQIRAPTETEALQWRQAIFEVQGKTVKVQYLSDHRLSNREIAALLELSKGGQQYYYAKAWINGVARGTDSRIDDAIELIRSAGAATSYSRRVLQASDKDTMHVNDNAAASAIALTAEAEPELTEEGREQARAGVEAAGRAGESVGRAIVDTARSAIRYMVPSRTESAEQQPEPEILPEIETETPAEIVSEPAAEEEIKIETAEAEMPEESLAVEIPGEYTRPGTRPGTRIAHMENLTTGTGKRIEFEVEFDPSLVSAPYHREIRNSDDVAMLLNDPKNRRAVIEVRYREEGGDWQTVNAENSPTGMGRFYHDFFIKIARRPVTFVERDRETGKIRSRIHLFVERSLLPPGIDYRTADFETLRNSGAVVGFGRGPPGNIETHYLDDLEDYMRDKEGKYAYTRE